MGEGGGGDSGRDLLLVNRDVFIVIFCSVFFFFTGDLLFRVVFFFLSFFLFSLVRSFAAPLFCS